MSTLLRAAIVCVLYFGSALLALALQVPGTQASPVWLPSAVLAVAVLRWGGWMVLPVAVAAAGANLYTLPALGVLALPMALGHGAQAVLVWSLLRPGAESYWRVLGVAGIAALASAAWGPWWVGAALGWVPSVEVVGVWWLGDLTGLLLGLSLGSSAWVRGATLLAGAGIALEVWLYLLIRQSVPGTISALSLGLSVVATAAGAYGAAATQEMARLVLTRRALEVTLRDATACPVEAECPIRRATRATAEHRGARSRREHADTLPLPGVDAPL